MPARTLERPTLSFTSRFLCCVGFLKSASSNKMLRPVCAMAIARLLALVVLPSPGSGDVTSNVLARLPRPGP